MVERDVLKPVKVRKTPKEGFILTIPKEEVAQPLKLKGDEKAIVLLDVEKRRIIYEIQDRPKKR